MNPGTVDGRRIGILTVHGGGTGTAASYGDGYRYGDHRGSSSCTFRNYSGTGFGDGHNHGSGDGGGVCMRVDRCREPLCLTHGTFKGQMIYQLLKERT